MPPIRIALIGERDLNKTAHRGIEASLALAAAPGNLDQAFSWVPTASLTPGSFQDTLENFSGIWCTPGSPYESTEGALLAVEFARTSGRPFLGTCGGFQHALMEYARNVLGREAAHAELSPEATDPLISRLSCSLVGAQGRIIVTRPELFAAVLGAAESVEEFNCNYGLNHRLAGVFSSTDLAFVAHDQQGQERAFRLNGHPFYVGTLFQPERRALAGSIHPVVSAFLCAASASKSPPRP